MRTFSTVISSVFLAVLFATAGPAVAARHDQDRRDQFLFGAPSFTEPYRKGWQLALEEINAAGGVDGKKLEVISKDDGGKPADAVTAANELVASDGVHAAGTFFSNIGLAVSDFAKQKKILFLAAEPLTDAITLVEGQSLYVPPAPLQLRAGGDAGGRGGQAAGEEMGDDRAELRIRPVGGRGLQEAALRQAARHPMGRRAMAAAGQDRRRRGGRGDRQDRAGRDPQCHFRADLVKLVREGNTRGLFKDRAVVSFLTGEPEYLDPLKDETPEGWIVTGYPWNAVTIPEHAAFLKAYQAKYNDYPRLGSVVGYSTLKSAAAILAKAKSTDSEKLVDAAEGILVETPFGRGDLPQAIDHQSTLGAFVGKTALKDGKGVMVDVIYRDGAKSSAGKRGQRRCDPAGLMLPRGVFT
jgi:branched-chain amino acid transport system substrate-binding protein